MKTYYKSNWWNHYKIQPFEEFSKAELYLLSPRPAWWLISYIPLSMEASVSIPNSINLRLYLHLSFFLSFCLTCKSFNLLVPLSSCPLQLLDLMFHFFWLSSIILFSFLSHLKTTTCSGTFFFRRVTFFLIWPLLFCLLYSLFWCLFLSLDLIFAANLRDHF